MKNVYYTQQCKKLYLTNSGYYGGKFLYMGAFFSVWKKLVWENLKFIFQGQILFIGDNFQFGEILNLCFRDKFRFGKLFLVWANLCMGNLKYLFWGLIFLSKGFLKYMKRLLLNQRIERKIFNFGVIILKVGCIPGGQAFLRGSMSPLNKTRGTGPLPLP